MGMARVGLLLGVLAAIKIYVDTRRLISLAAVPAGVLFAVAVASVVVLAQGNTFVSGTDATTTWTWRSLLGLGAVVVFAFGSTIARSAGASPLLYVLMLVVGTAITVLVLRKDHLG